MRRERGNIYALGIDAANRIKLSEVCGLDFDAAELETSLENAKSLNGGSWNRIHNTKNAETRDFSHEPLTT